MLKNQVKIYIPSTTDVNVSNINKQDEWADKTLTALSNWFGGATVMDATGAWVSQSKGLIKEQIKIVYAFCNGRSLNDNLINLLNHVKEVCKDMSQECVSLEINGVLYFVTGKPSFDSDNNAVLDLQIDVEN